MVGPPKVGGRVFSCVQHAIALPDRFVDTTVPSACDTLSPSDLRRRAFKDRDPSRTQGLPLPWLSGDAASLDGGWMGAVVGGWLDDGCVGRVWVG